MKCPSCGSEGEAGRFCAECGAALRVVCPECGAEPPPGSTFCPSCGHELAGRRSRTPHPVWWIALAAAAVVILILLIPQRADRAGPPLMTDPGVGAPFTGPGGLSADMRTNADRLFNRVMTAAERGDRAEVDQFLPMAIQAYQMVDGLDDDGLFHLAILHLTAGDPAEARATAELVLARHPDHILALGVAGAAAAAAGDHAAATAYYQRILDVYAEESGRLRPEYMDHEPMLRQYRDEARAYLSR